MVQVVKVGTHLNGYTHIYVGRPSSYKPSFGLDASFLGNPFPMKEEDVMEKPWNAIKSMWEAAKKEIDALGGTEAFKSGTWFVNLLTQSFKSYWEKSNSEYFKSKYKNQNVDFIIKKLTNNAARNASLLGAVVGAAISTDEIVGIVTAGEFGIGLPANISVAVAGVLGEIVMLTRIQLQLVANIGKLMGVPFNPDDPEDAITIIAFALGGNVAEQAGKVGMKIGRGLIKTTIKTYISKEVLAAIKKIGTKIGIKILQKTIIKYAIPGASIAVGATWNFGTTKAIGKIATKHFKARLNEIK